MNTNTPGEWQIETVSDAVRIIVGSGRKKVILARLNPPQLSEEETHANARLMRAAPELREALREWKCPACGGSGTYRQEWSRKYPEGFDGTCRKCDGKGLHPLASAAIAKAEERR